MPLEMNAIGFRLPAWTQGLPRKVQPAVRPLAVRVTGWTEEDPPKLVPEPAPRLGPFRRTARGTWAWTEPGCEWVVWAMDHETIDR